MDQAAVFVMLLLLGVCVSSLSDPTFYLFINERMTWYEAQEYCVLYFTGLAQILSLENLEELLEIQAAVDTDKAWIGLTENVLDLSWVDGGSSSFSDWRPDVPNKDTFCVTMTTDGYWMSATCSAKRTFVCRGAGGHFFLAKDKATWEKAKTLCKQSESVLATITNSQENREVERIVSEEAKETTWIGLSGSRNWSWSETGHGLGFDNWQAGEPDMLSGENSCGAIQLLNGTWSDEECSNLLPCFCYGTNVSVSEQKQTVVRMEIKSSADMEDRAHSAALQRQLHAKLAKQGVTDVKLAWKTLPEKQAEEIRCDERCLMKH